MDPNVQGSFIPKAALAQAQRGGGMGLFFIIALLIFVMSLVAATAAFGYTRIVQSQIADKDSSLRKDEGAFDPKSIEDLSRLDSRLIQAKTLLGNHVSPSAIFGFLSGITLQRVQYLTMDYQLQPDGSANITLTGVADSFSSVALQSDQYSAAKVLKDVIFSGITVADNGKVNFTINANIERDVLLYNRNLSSATP